MFCLFFTNFQHFFSNCQKNYKLKYKFQNFPFITNNSNNNNSNTQKNSNYEIEKEFKIKLYFQSNIIVFDKKGKVKLK